MGCFPYKRRKQSAFYRGLARKRMATKQTNKKNNNQKKHQCWQTRDSKLTCTTGRWGMALMTACRKLGSSCLTGLHLAKIEVVGLFYVMFFFFYCEVIFLQSMFYSVDTFQCNRQGFNRWVFWLFLIDLQNICYVQRINLKFTENSMWVYIYLDYHNTYVMEPNCLKQCYIQISQSLCFCVQQKSVTVLSKQQKKGK